MNVRGAMVPDIEPIDYGNLLRRVRARFCPKRTDDLKPGVSALVGRTFEFDCVDYGRDEEDPYPGQYRWMTDDAALQFWVPDEDLDIIEDLGKRHR